MGTGVNTSTETGRHAFAAGLSGRSDCYMIPGVSARCALDEIDVNAPAGIVWKFLVKAKDRSSYFPSDGRSTWRAIPSL